MQPGCFDDLATAMRALSSLLMNEIADVESETHERMLVHAVELFDQVIAFAKTVSLEGEE